MMGPRGLLTMFLIAAVSTFGQASSVITRRDNWAGIPCGNAMNVIAGKCVFSYLPDADNEC